VRLVRFVEVLLPRVALFAVMWTVPGCGGGSIPDVEGVEVTITDENFEREVLQSTSPVLLDFGATWCRPCRQMEPSVAQLSVQYEDRLKVGKVDVDEDVQIADQFQVNSMPTFVLVRDGNEVARISGLMSYNSLAKWVDSYLPR